LSEYSIPTEGDPILSETTSGGQDTSLPPRERAEKVVEAMTLEQKIAQLHGAMETIDIYAITREAAGVRGGYGSACRPDPG
jgi:hypothetical protein